jgi:hypothetical protein
LVVKAAENIASDDVATPLNWPTMWGIFMKAEMSPGHIVVSNIPVQDAPQKRPHIGSS